MMTHVIWNDNQTGRLPSGQRLARVEDMDKYQRVWLARADTAIRIPTGIFNSICVGEIGATKEETTS